ncbi:NAD(P)/FAD-dependent oxidoreductase [Salinarimonas ramus]|uniref:FAD-binding oxidoreductase n=1 Tax=Salinarimonas ramus TaxID=690164 RepID=A0A917V896_9HYPH|nr:FAD-binding oxidoreductase [Salinarimonas ramus]GGK50776.1 FAD-binding oxidoreductase [Salinarimonas ramus]
MTSLPARIDIAIIGGGVVGLSLARILARAGEDVLLLDEGRHAGTTANAGSLHVQMQSRFIRLYPEQVPALERALPLYVAAARLWAELEAELGADFELKRSGGLMIAENRAQYDFLARKCDRERALGLDVEMVGRADLLRLAPYLDPDAVYGAELCADEGKLNPLLANAALTRAARDAGARIVGETRVEHLAQDGRGFRVETSRGPVRAARVVLAAGAGTGALAAQLGVPIPTAAEPLHMNVTEPIAPVVRHLVQHAERMITLKQLASGHVVVGGGWPARLAGEGTPLVERASILGNLALAARLAPGIAQARVIRTWAGVNTTCDGASIIGAAGPSGLFVAVPGDAGYTLGPLVARLAAQAIRGERPDFDLAPYDPGRFARREVAIPA